MAGTINVKIILLGESGVGKTSILLRFKCGEFRENTRNTFIDHYDKSIKVRDKEVKLSIWDTAGQEQFRSIVRSYYRQADGVLLLYDVTNVTTFHILTNWLSDLRLHNERAQVIIVGNKNEDPSKKSVAVTTVKTFAREENLEYLEVSAKSGANVDKVFHYLTEKILIEKGILSQLPEENASSSKAAESPPESTTSHLSVAQEKQPGSHKSDPNSHISDSQAPEESIKLHDQPSQKTEEPKKKGCC